MTLVELRYLVTLAEQKHFGRAAELCHVSQPTLSMAVRKLEENLGVLLFERSKSGIRATTMGTQIIEQARRVMAQVSVISAIADAGKDQLIGELRLGSIFTLGPYLLPQLISQLRINASGLRLNLYENYKDELRKRLCASELDAILVSLPFAEPDIVIQELFEEPLLAVMPPNHVLAAQAIVDPADLIKHPFLLLTKGHCLRENVLGVCPSLDDPERTNVLESSSLETLRHMVATGLGVSILPSSAITSSLYTNAFVARSLHGMPTRKLALAWRASFPRHRAIDALRKAIQTCCWQFTTGHDNTGQGLLVENNW